VSDTIDVAVVGAGQAGLATSWWLSGTGIEHVVLEAGQVGEAWRHRWRSLRLVSPNFLNRLPGYPYAGDDPEGFLTRTETIAYLEGYAASFDAPVRTATPVQTIAGDSGAFRVLAGDREIRARAVVVATGAHQRPHVPAGAASLPVRLLQLHSDAYAEPDELPPGGVLVVGGGQAGCQIALEVLASGRPVTLAAGRCAWYPRRLYGRDILWWRDQMGEFDVLTDELPDPAAARAACTPLIKAGDADLNLRVVADAGVSVVGRFLGASDRRAIFGTDLHAEITAADDAARAFVARIHPYAREMGATSDAEPAPLAYAWAGLPPIVRELDLAPIATVIWATGHRPDFSWIELPVRDVSGAPLQHGGVSPVAGLYFMGLHLMVRRGSGFILGVGRDAQDVVGSIASGLARRAGRDPAANSPEAKR
jgi:putative flavoprotein involved in K+ transport